MLLTNIHDFNRQNISAFHNEIDRLNRAGLKKKVGFFGQPDQKTMEIFRNHGFEFLDLDIDFGNPKQTIVPDVYCHIIRDIINNAVYFQSDLDYIICTTGADKCDQGRNVRDLLSRLDFNVIDASNINMNPIREPIISNAKGNLRDRIIRIMELIYKPLTSDEKEHYLKNQCEPEFNFHGVPPHDIDLLNLFPEETHINGWTKLVEMGTPSRADLEWDVDNAAPTVYFSQSFCNKQMMSNYLADKHQGLYLDGHGTVTGSMKAKLEAFLTLRSKKRMITTPSLNKESHYVAL